MNQEQLHRQDIRRQMRRTMVEAEINRHPIWPESGEEGKFVAIIGWLTGAGVYRCPYYKTEDGIYFALSKRDDTRDQPFLLDMERMKKERHGAKFYSVEAFINEDSSVTEPILEPYHKDSSTRS